MKFDYHVHSNFSNDSFYEMEDVINDAIKLGIEEICFTEHVDYDIKPEWYEDVATLSYHGKEVRNVNYPIYFKTLDEMIRKYNDKITIKKGLEFGIQTHTIPRFNKLFESYDLDFVLLSIHQVDNKEFWTGAFQEGKTIAECYDAYYEEMYAVVQNFHNYSVLAHMDLIRRYVDKDVDHFEDTKQILTKILKYIIKDGKGIEVNTSSFYYKVDGLTPSIEILKLYYELGGTIITIGSDSHRPEQLGTYIEDMKEVLIEIGFKQYCTFTNMIPTFHDF